MNTFKEMNLSPEILRAISDLGFEEPTPIQREVIPAILESQKDITGLAQTGTGKTAGFGLPLLQMIDVLSGDVQALILSPTRELGIQIGKDIENYAKYLEDLKIVTVYGGADINKQIRQLKQKPQIVVGTPGRVLDMIRRKILKVDKLDWLVLDEADEMLNMGFKEDLDNILETTPSNKRTFLFSATMPKEVARIAEKYMRDAIEISVGKKNAGAEQVSHEYYMVPAKYRYETLKRLADYHPDMYGLVFCRTRRETREVSDKLIKDGYNADALHGDLSQAQRDMVMKRFRSRAIQLLVATDVAARGLDVNDLTHVINYNLPDDKEVYIHRSGRTGRAGKEGKAISIAHSREKGRVREIERLVKKKFEKKEVPGGEEICEKQLLHFIDKMEQTEVDEQQIEKYLDAIYQKLNGMSREELIKHFVSLEFNRFLAGYKNAPNLNTERSDKGKKRKRTDSVNRVPEENFSRFFINAGTKQNLSPARLMGLINEQTRSGDIEIGKIDIMKKFSFFEVESAAEPLILKSFKKAEFEGQRIIVERSKPEGETPQGKSPKKKKGKKKRNR